MGRKANGRIYRPPGKSFLMIAYWGPKADGSWGEIRESAGSDDEAKARAKLDDRLREVENHRRQIRPFEGPTAARLTVGELLDAVKADWQLRERKSLSQTLPHLERVREALGSRKAMSLTPDQIRAWVKRMKAEPGPLANGTINRRLEVLGRAYRLAIEERRLATGPKITFLRESKPRQGFFERDEFEALLPHLPAPFDAMARFAFLTGWRRGELLGLRWEWVDRRAREIRIPDSKNGEGRSLPLDDTILWPMFEQLWEARATTTATGTVLSAYVFHRKGRAIPRGAFMKRWRKACKDAKLEGKLFHDFRRTAARNMVRAGVPETVAMKVTGHKTRSMLDRYSITNGADQLEALRRSQAFVAEKKETESAKVISHPNSHPGA
jgi:integrase